VATYFHRDPAVVFDLYNEPHDISWGCWRDGCVTSGGWPAAGMQSLVNAVRSTGATQPVLLGGLGWSSDLSSWLAFRPRDPANQTSASFHVYNFSGCNTATCWSAQVAPVAASVPVVTGEIGENDCASGFIASYMGWADAHAVSYLGWTWDTWNCSSGPALITAYDGTPDREILAGRVSVEIPKVFVRKHLTPVSLRREPRRSRFGGRESVAD
jgi:hypothetical protein